MYQQVKLKNTELKKIYTKTFLFSSILIKCQQFEVFFPYTQTYTRVCMWVWEESFLSSDKKKKQLLIKKVVASFLFILKY